MGAAPNVQDATGGAASISIERVGLWARRIALNNATSSAADMAFTPSTEQKI